MLVTVCAPAIATQTAFECGDYIAEGNPEVRFQSSGGVLSKTLKQTARQILPVGYTLDSLGFAVPGAEAVTKLAGLAVSGFSAVSTDAQSKLPAENLTSYLAIPPNVLILDDRRDLTWFFTQYTKYGVETYAPEKGSDLIARFLPHDQKPGTQAGFDYILAPESWQRLTVEARVELLKGAYALLREGGTLRMTVRLHDVDRIAPELNVLTEEAGAQRLFASFQRQVNAALGNQGQSMMVRVQKTAYAEPAEGEPAWPDFWQPLGPTIALAGTRQNFNPLEPIQRPSLQALVVVRKPGQGWGEWVWGY